VIIVPVFRPVLQGRLQCTLTPQEALWRDYQAGLANSVPISLANAIFCLQKRVAKIIAQFKANVYFAF
jgi:hypothetical protein